MKNKKIIRIGEVYIDPGTEKEECLPYREFEDGTVEVRQDGEWLPINLQDNITYV